MRLHGKSGIVYLGATTTADASPVAFLSDWTVNFNRARIDLTAIGDETHRYLSSLGDVTGDFSGFYDDATSQLYAEAMDSLPRRFYLYPQASYPNRYVCGSITADFSITGGVAAAVAVKSTWVAAAPTVRLNTDFVINVHASIAGQGQCVILPAQASGLAGQGVITATPTVVPTQQLTAGTGQCSAIPRTEFAIGAGVVSPITPIIGVTTLLAGAGKATARPIVSVTPDPDTFQGRGSATSPGGNFLFLTGTGITGPVTPIIGVKALLQGGGAAVAAPTQAIGVTALLQGAGVSAPIPTIGAGRTAALTGAGSATSGKSVTGGGTALTVTATASGAGKGNGIALQIMVLTQVNTTQTGAGTASQSSTSAAAKQAAITTTVTASRVYGALLNWDSATGFTPNGNTTEITDSADGVNGVEYCTVKATSATGTPGSISIGSSSPSANGCASFLEILANGTITEDASAPAYIQATGAATVTSASFTAPAGSYLVALVSAGGTAGVVTMTVTGTSFSFTQRISAAPSGDGYTGVWTAQA